MLSIRRRSEERNVLTSLEANSWCLLDRFSLRRRLMRLVTSRTAGVSKWRNGWAGTQARKRPDFTTGATMT